MPYRYLKDKAGRRWRTLCLSSDPPADGEPTLNYGDGDGPQGSIALAEFSTATLRVMANDPAVKAVPEFRAMLLEILGTDGESADDTTDNGAGDSPVIAAARKRRRRGSAKYVADESLIDRKSLAASFGSDLAPANTVLGVAQRRHAERARQK